MISRAILSICAIAAAALPCRADPFALELSASSGTTITIADNGAGDLNPLPGVVLYSGAVGGNFIVNISSGISDDYVAPATIDLVSGNMATAADTLRVRFSGTGFTDAIEGMNLRWGGVLTGPVGSTVSAAAWVDDADLLFGTSVLAASLGPFGPGAFSGSAGGPVAVSGAFSLTQEITINLTGPGMYSGNVEFTHTPEPGAWLLLASVMGGLALKFRRRLQLPKDR